VFIAFTVGAPKDTCNNVLATGEFVVNVPPFEREILEKVRVCGLEFPTGVNELEKAGLSGMASKLAQTPAHRRVPQPLRMPSRMDETMAASRDGRGQSRRGVRG
jgi:hypothetical protein